MMLRICSLHKRGCQKVRLFWMKPCRQNFFVICLTAIVFVLSIVPAIASKTPAPGKIKIIVGGEIDYPPYSFLDKNGEPTGFSVELTRAIAKIMGMDIEIRLRPWSEVRKALENSKIDIIPGMFYSEERATIYDFSPPFCMVSSAVFTRGNTPTVKSIEDLRNKETIVMRSEAMHDYILKYHLTDRLLLTETTADALRLLASGKGDYALVAQMPGYYWIRELNLSNITTVGPSLEPFKNCFAVRKGNTLLLSRFTEGLNILHQTGEYRNLYEKWLGVLEPTRITSGLIFKYAATVFVPLILLLAASLLWSWMLRSRVNQKTKELQESEETFRTHVENSFDIIFTLNKDGEFLFVSNAWERYFGYPVSEVTGKSFTLFVHTDDVSPCVEYLKRTLSTGQGGTSPPFRVKCTDGNFLWFVANGTPHVDTKGNLQFIGVGRDITASRRAEDEKRLMEERLQRAEKMEALGTLAGGVAHDLNNVLGIVVGYSEMLLGGLEESNPLRSDVKNIMEGGERAAAIVQDLLTLARRGVQTRKVVNLNTVILDCQKTPEFEKLFSFHPSVRIGLELEADLLNIVGSPVHLGKTFMNLVSNALEAMPEGGTLTVRTANQYLDRPIQGYDHVREGDYVVLSLSDTGEGIAANDIRHIFEPFYTKKVMGKSGTGLGLAVVWGTVKDHHGYIDVESEEGKGTRFTLYLPVTREDLSEEPIGPSLSEYMGRQESILVVDDVKGQRELATRMLTRLQYRVTAVASGEEAVEYLKTGKVDLMVLDMIMDPGMDGLETYRKVIEGHPGQKAIILSGFSESERVKEAQGLGVGAYVRKPYVLERLGLAVRKELDREK